MKNTLMACLVMLALAAGAVCRGDDDGDRGRSADAIRAEIGKLQARIDELEAKAVATERVDEMKDEFADIRQESHKQLKDYAQWARELEDQDKAETSEEERRRSAALAHIRKCRGIHRQILALKDYRELQKARELRDALEAAQVEWDMVLEPLSDGLALIAEMEAEAGLPQLKEMVQQIRAQHDEYVSLGRKELEIWKARRQCRKKIEADQHKFWETIEGMEGK